MKYKVPILAFLLFYLIKLPAQNHDYNWLFGYGAPDSEFGNSSLDFNYSPPLLSTIDFNVNFQSCGGSCSDSLGNLLFYTNGLRIYNNLNEIMEGGDTINPGAVWENVQNDGYVSIAPIFALPKPLASNIYYLIHTDIENAAGTSFTKNLYYTVIDMNANNGLGKVLEKNVSFLEGDLMCPAAVKHGNGRDWWIMGLQEADTNHYLFLLSQEGITGPYIQDIGPPFDSVEYSGKSLFSENGEIYLRHDSNAGLRIYDFDRCSGLLSNLRIVPFQEELHSWFAAFSPNGRFLYFNRPGFIWSIDLEAPDISSSYDTLSTWELNYCPSNPFSSHYFLSQLGPDGKIYFSTFSGATQCLNMIHRPNLPGDAADSEEAALSLPRWNRLTLTQFPNYRLAEWDDAPCDTINFQQPNDGFMTTSYIADRFAQPNETNSSYLLFPRPPVKSCKGCSETDLAYLNNPMKIVYALYVLQTTGELPPDWPKEIAKQEGFQLLPPKK